MKLLALIVVTLSFMDSPFAGGVREQPQEELTVIRVSAAKDRIDEVLRNLEVNCDQNNGDITPFPEPDSTLSFSDARVSLDSSISGSLFSYGNHHIGTLRSIDSAIDSGHIRSASFSDSSATYTNYLGRERTRDGYVALEGQFYLVSNGSNLNTVERIYDIGGNEVIIASSKEQRMHSDRIYTVFDENLQDRTYREENNNVPFLGFDFYVEESDDLVYVIVRENGAVTREHTRIKGTGGKILIGEDVIYGNYEKSNVALSCRLYLNYI